jgi:hypothetical protein
MLPRLVWGIKENPYCPARAESAGRANKHIIVAEPKRRDRSETPATNKLQAYLPVWYPRLVEGRNIWSKKI